MRQQIQSFGRKLSAMVMPNIGAFIAWGLITAIFIKGGWWPNEKIAQMVSPMLTYLLPTLIAYTAGKNVAGVRGGVAGAVAAMGVIIGSDTPMFLGAMIMGPIAGYAVKKFDKLVEGRIHSGFEMLVDNFSLGIIAMILSIIGFLLIGHAVSWLTHVLSNGVNWMLAHKMNPLLAVLVDPAKVLFLNNAVNHGIMTPLGIQQAADIGQSMLFLVDPNPGPGLGILLGCWFFGKGTTKQSAPGAAVIQLLGGIHEIYFPYVLARPILLLAVMAGNICALSFFTLVDFGLVAPASPGSLISIILMSPRGKTLLGILGVIIGTAVSFLLSIPMIKKRPDFQGEAENAETSPASNVPIRTGAVSKIVFACDAGMGSSALGATRFKARLMKAGLGHIHCTNSAVDTIPSDASVVVCQAALADRARATAPGKEIIVITNFLSDPALDSLMEQLVSLQKHPRDLGNVGGETACCEAGEALGCAAPGGRATLGNVRGGTACGGVGEADAAGGSTPQGGDSLLIRESILVNLRSEDKESAIRRAGELLVRGGYVGADYVDAMVEREKLTTTYMGMGLAIPHGTSEAKSSVLKSGIVVLQYPDGVDFGDTEPGGTPDPDNLAHLVIGIAGVGDRHLEILAKVAGALEDPDVLERLSSKPDAEDIYAVLGK